MVFVKNGENISDIFTKKFSSVLCKMHAMYFIKKDVCMIIF